MLLADIKNHLQSQPRQSLLDLSRQFKVEAHAMRDMLSLLVRKGLVRQCTKTPLCGTKCSQCDVLTVEMYEWVAN